jgi:hypothetical protein
MPSEARLVALTFAGQETRDDESAFSCSRPRWRAPLRRVEHGAAGDAAATHGVAAGAPSRVGLGGHRAFAGGPGFRPGAARAAASCQPAICWSASNGRSLERPHFAYKLARLGALTETVPDVVRAVGHGLRWQPGNRNVLANRDRRSS